MRQETKDRIASKFLEHPLLHMLVRALLCSLGFRLCVVGFLLLPVVLALALTRIWRVTPPGFTPVIRINVLDWLQARALERTAVRELGRGEINDGLIAYNMALANNPGNVRVARAFLRQIHERVEAPAFQMPALQRAFWLLRLTSTNLVDLELAAATFEKYGFDQHLIQLLEPLHGRLTPGLQKTFLVALFNDGRTAEFDHYWHGLQLSPGVLNDPEIRLYRAAFAAGWGTSETINELNPRLEDHLGEGPWQVVANRLYLRVCEQRNEAEVYLATLQRLQDWHKDRLLDHVRAWRLLVANRRLDQAAKLAKAYDGSPATGLETVHLARAFTGLGLRERAQDLLDRFTLEFSFLDGLWVLYADLLIESRQWDELHRLALRMRLKQEVSDRLSAYSYFLEGRVELAQNRPGIAAQLFSRISASRHDNLDLALVMGRSLADSGHAEAARSLLRPLEQAGQRNPAYWESLVAVAFASKDEALLLRAATQAVTLSPTSWPARNNYAAALVINGESPGEAIKETFQLSQQFPNNQTMQINHAFALLQNHRYAAADRLLARLDAAALTDSERAAYRLACFETLVAQERFDLARLFLRQIDSGHLFASQRERLVQLRQKLQTANEPAPAQVAVSP